MAIYLPLIGGPDGQQPPCAGNPIFYAPSTPDEFEACEAACWRCAWRDGCTEWAVATVEATGSLLGTWAGERHAPDGRVYSRKKDVT